MTMDLMFLDADFAVCGITDDFTSLVWRRRFFSFGDFELTLPEKYRSAAFAARYVYNPTDDRCALIEKRSVRSGKDGSQSFVLSGRLAESLLAFRALDRPVLIDGLLENGVRSLVTDFAASGSRAVPHLALAESHGYTETVTAQAYSSSLSQFLFSTLCSFGMSYSLRYSANEEKLLFDIIKGADRTQPQGTYPPAVFSTSLGSIINCKYSVNDAPRRNVAYVSGQSSSGSRLTVTVTSDGAGTDRRETFVSSSGISRFSTDANGVSTALSDEEYSRLLAGKGRERLASQKRSVSFSGLVDLRHGMLLGRDFDLGDVCCCEIPEAGVSENLRLCETVFTSGSGTDELFAAFSSP